MRIRTISRFVKKILRAIACLLPCLSLLFVNNVFAVNYLYSGSVTLTGGRLVGTEDYWQLRRDNSIFSGGVYRSADFTGSGFFDYFYVDFEGTIPADSIAVIHLHYKASSLSSAASAVFYPLPLISRSSLYSVLDISYGEYGSTTVTLWIDNDISGRLSLYTGSSDILLNGSNAMFSVSDIDYVVTKDPPTYAQLQDIIEILGDTSSSAAIAQNTADTVDLLQEQNQQQQDQYDQEKQEEQNREEQQSGDMAGIGFSFSLINPFEALFTSFSAGNSCVPIPMLSSMLHTQQTTFCPMFPQSVRSVLTPVLMITSMMLVFGFIVRWLNSSGGDGTIKIKGDK